MAAKRAGDTTSISWTHHPGYHGATWNPVTGCTRVSPGCDNCYAFTLHDQRFAANLDAMRKFRAAIGLSTVPAAASYAHITALRDMTVRSKPTADSVVQPLPFPAQYDRPFSFVQVLDDQRLFQPIRKQAPQCYFVDSMNDLFHEDISDAALDRIFAVMALTPRHRYLILTKRPERMREYMGWSNEQSDRAARVEAAAEEIASLRGRHFEMQQWPLPHVGLGVSTENQEMAEERIPLLLDTPAAVRFISAEPLLEEIELDETWLFPHAPVGLVSSAGAAAVYHVGEYQRGLDWVIVGGESGPRVRPMDDDWARSLRLQCEGTDAAFFYKQPSGTRSGLPGPDDLAPCKALPPFPVAYRLTEM